MILSYPGLMLDDEEFNIFMEFTEIIISNIHLVRSPIVSQNDQNMDLSQQVINIIF